MKIVVLIATYNGASFLREQIDSILTQTVKVDLLIRDDNSKDETMQVLEEYERTYPNIRIVRNVDGGGSSMKNFSVLLGLDMVDNYDYVMFADQDDVWLPFKVEKTLELMQQLEVTHGSMTPILVHTDLEVIATDGARIAPSFWQHNGFKPWCNQLSRLLIDNTVTGCTMMINKTLRNLALPVPVEATMHDAWLTLTASVFGKIGILYLPTMQYRQHGNNVIGAIGKENFFTKARIAIQLTLFSSKRSISTRHKQQEAKAFLERFGDRCTAEQNRVLDIFIHIYSYPRLLRIIYLFQYGFYKQRVVKTLGMILIWLLEKREPRV